jgi:hypothetical protein
MRPSAGNAGATCSRVPCSSASSSASCCSPGGFGSWTGAAAWTAIGVFLAPAGLALTAARLSRRQRDRVTAAHRLQAALRAHADPGPELRGRADQQARYTARTAWVVWTLPLGPLGLVIGGDWDSRPVAAAVGAALVVGAAVAYGLWTRARLTQARRWLADPPGPPREAPPPTAAERWSTGRRVAVVVGSVFVLAVAAGFVLAVTD